MMVKRSFFAILLMFAVALTAHAAQRTVLLETFTNTS